MTIQLLGGTAHSGVQLTPRTGADPRRGEGFEESCWERLQRVTLGLAWALKPRRILGVPGTLAVVVAHYAGPGRERDALPDPESALRHPDGLAGICRDMSVETLLAAYARGLFPFCHAGPMKWWAPSQRMVLLPHQYHIEKNLRRRLRQKHFRVTFDQGFEAVMRGCAGARPGRWHLTWITPRIMRAYQTLHEAGHAHSVEVWDEAGALAGGVYGVAVGRAFFTESQFARVRDSSKIGFAVLNRHLQSWGFRVNDGKHPTAHLAQLGFKPMPRHDFNALLAQACAEPGRVGRWQVDERLDVAGWEPGAGGA